MTCISPTTTVATYAYDAQGRRKAKTVGSAKTVFVTDADNREILEYDGTSGAVKAWYTYGLGSNEVLARTDVAAGTRQTMIPDILGSIIGTVDSATGAVTKTGYQAFGENPALASGNFNYTAQRFDPETAGSAGEPSGLYYYRARMYSPVLGRFLQPDPIGYLGGTNLYAYTLNSPINYTDPSGNIIPLLVAAGEFAADTAPIWGPYAAKAVAGFGLGYYGAKVTGVKSQQGRIISGLVGAVSFPGGSAVVQATSGVLTRTLVGGGIAYTSGYAGELAGQKGDNQNLDFGKANVAGLATLAGYTLFGEAAVTAASTRLGVAAPFATDLVTGTSTTIGGTGIQSIASETSSPAVARGNGSLAPGGIFSNDQKIFSDISAATSGSHK